MKLAREELVKEIEGHKDNLKHLKRSVAVTELAIRSFEKELKKYPAIKNKA